MNAINKILKWNDTELFLSTNSLEFVELLGRVEKLLGKGTLEIASAESKNDNVTKFIFENTIDFNVQVTSDKVILQCDLEFLENSSSILECVLLLAFERELQQNGKFTFHASAIKVGNEAYVFFGPKESGKTSISYALAKKIDNVKLISNDHCIVGMKNESPYIFKGDAVNFITFRSHALKKLDKDLYIKLFQSIDTPNIRRRVIPQEVGIQVHNNPTKIRRVYAIGLGHTPTVESYLVDTLMQKVMIYENLSSLIRGATVTLFDSDNKIGPYLPDFSNEQSHEKLIEFLNSLVKDKFTYSLRGPLEGILDKLEQDFVDDGNL